MVQPVQLDTQKSVQPELVQFWAWAVWGIPVVDTTVYPAVANTAKPQ